MTDEDRGLVSAGGAGSAGDDDSAWIPDLLARVDRPRMPEDVWLRLESTLAGLPQPVRTSGSDASRAGRRRPRRTATLLGGLAAACAAVLVGGLAVQSAVTTSPTPPLAPPPLGAALTSTSALAVLHTRTAYTTASLPAQVTEVLADAGLASTDDVRRALRRTESVRLPVLAPTGFTSAHPSIATCVRAVASALGVTPPALLVDRGTLDGGEVGVIVFSAQGDREVTIAVVTPDCDPALPVSSAVRATLP